MRELKFRQWLGNRFEYWGVGVNECTFVGPCSSGDFRADRTPHQQYTGLKDQHGVEIYEGDIVKEGDLISVVEYHTEDVGSCGCCYTEFDGAGFAAFGRDKSNRVTGMSLGEDCEVIGNVHQNPELVNT